MRPAVGAVAVMLWTMFPSAPKRALWVTMAMVALASYGGWWLLWPILGLHDPHLLAELDHGAAVLVEGTAILPSRRDFDGVHVDARRPIGASRNPH